MKCILELTDPRTTFMGNNVRLWGGGDAQDCGNSS